MKLTSEQLNWLLGFIEGEGNFIIIVSKHSSYSFNVAFQLGQKEKRPLEFCQSLIGGRICKRADGCWVLMVSKLEETLKMVTLGDLKWHTEKRKDFDIWKKALFLMVNKNKKNYTLGFVKKMLNLREKLCNKNHPRYIPKEDMLKRITKLNKNLLSSQI